MNSNLAKTIVKNMVLQFGDRVNTEEPIPGWEAVEFIADAVRQARETEDATLIITSGLLFKGWTLTLQGDGSYTLYDPVSRLELKNVKLLDSTKDMERIHCASCGKPVSTPVPKPTIVRAWVECPECVNEP
jgi:hypothetical protein